MHIATSTDMDMLVDDCGTDVGMLVQMSCTDVGMLVPGGEYGASGATGRDSYGGQTAPTAHVHGTRKIVVPTPLLWPVRWHSSQRGSGKSTLIPYAYQHAEPMAARISSGMMLRARHY
eukprot:2107043-Rhodomonas_salina.3